MQSFILGVNTTIGPIATTHNDCASVVCPQVVNPVCGSDGVTYGNVCQLLKAFCVQRRRITVMKNGPCGKAEYFFLKIILAYRVSVK